MNELKKGYHITKKSKLYSIQKNGLQPSIGRRSFSVNENMDLLYFSPKLSSMLTWKEQLYKDQPFDELAILTFDLDGLQYESRYDSSGDFFLETAVSPDKIRLLQIIKKGTPNDTVSLDHLRDIIMDNSSNNNNSQYEIFEKKITEIFIEKPIIDTEKKRLIIEKLAEYEHKKWRDEYSRIEWKAKRTDNGDLVLADQDVNQIQKYINLNYDHVESYYKEYIRKAVMESLFIMQDNNLANNFEGFEELISILEHAEYMRRNRWNKYMLSVCSLNNGKYVIPSEQAEIWKKEMIMAYSELSEQQKESYRKEVYNILEEIEKRKSSKQRLKTEAIETEVR